MAFRPPSLSAVSAFEAAARHQNFTKAADELNLTHGAVSHAIRGLEERLGVRLFERHGKGVLLTEAGRKFAGRVRLSLGLLGDLFDTTPWLERNRLVISVLPLFATQILVPRLGGFRDLYPDVAIELRSGDALAALGDGTVDIGLRYGPGAWSGVSAVKLADEELFPVISPHLAGGMPRSPEDLIGHEFIGHPEFPWAPWLQAAGLDPVEPKHRLTTTDSAIAMEAAVAGMGVLLGRSLMVEQELIAGRLVRPFDLQVRSNYAYWLAWSEGSPRIELIRTFKDWFVGVMTGSPA